MGTSAAVITNRQLGKSILGSKVTHVWLDEAAELFEGIEKPKEYLEFTTPPLAIVVAMQEAGKSGVEIYKTLVRVGKQSDSTTKINIEHQAKAAKIYDYFAKKHTMRRIKGEFVSEYMLAVDDLIENGNKIDKEHAAILVSLPRIYEQNRSLERVMKGHKSAPKPNSLTYPAMEGVVEFVEKIHVKNGHNNQVHYYFSTPNNYLMRVVVKKGEYGEVAWDTLSQAKKLHIDCEKASIYNIKGYDFNVMQFLPQSTKITII